MLSVSIMVCRVDLHASTGVHQCSVLQRYVILADRVNRPCTKCYMPVTCYTTLPENHYSLNATVLCCCRQACRGRVVRARRPGQHEQSDNQELTPPDCAHYSTANPTQPLARNPRLATSAKLI